MNKSKIKGILLGILVLALLGSNIATLVMYLNTFKKDPNKEIRDYGDEISRAKYFIIDWYNELSTDYKNPSIYKNEIQFTSTYVLTVFANRIRCVYPKGVRFFNLEYITYAEFSKDNLNTSCTFYYDVSGSYKFNIK